MQTVLFKRTMAKAVHPEDGVRYYCLPCAKAVCPAPQMETLLRCNGTSVCRGRVRETWSLVQVKNQPCAACQQ